MKLAVLLLLAVTVFGDSDMKQNVISFQRPWNRFTRDLFGCTEEVLYLNDCNQSIGFINYEAWKRSRESAKRLFDLEDRKR